jgi:hypothetical protein
MGSTRNAGELLNEGFDVALIATNCRRRGGVFCHEDHDGTTKITMHFDKNKCLRALRGDFVIFVVENY